ncbi:Tripartite-type tricarboxylate transporter, receptor component TctC [Tindallia magadiensis]|uniref:Tripartite-type tricarboxylate transporter, receptor component TctC n=1 Tax=Tindallia magadiensis TaxID=69895 RepID=A0A1I3BCH9_9FIRM|nr:tripartite tricarboxylate transporter substrate binding protein [Tindallia magadiensis]SFH59994.1 Tripartite-type tricarboxylate transporter, receptor component TctC [Tindallia magadiensis]
MNIRRILLLLLALILIGGMVTGCGGEEPVEEAAPTEMEESAEETEASADAAEEDVDIDVIVGFGAGGSNDLTARYMAEYLREFGINANIVNMPGGMSTEAAYHVANQSPDSNMFFWGHTGPLLFEPAAGDRGYTIDDFEAVATLASPTFVIGNRSGAPWETLDELIEYIQENPGEVVFGGQGEGNVRHYIVEKILPPDELDYIFVGLEGGADVALNLTGGHVDVGHLSLAAAVPLHQDGDMTVMVNTQPLVERDPLMEEVPNVSEFGIEDGRERHPIALWAIKGTDPALIDRISTAIGEIAELPELQESFKDMGVVAHYLNAEETWEFYMDVKSTMIPDYMEWIETLD